jgi:transposase
VSLPDPQARIASLERELAWAHLKIQSLVEELRQFRVKLLGPKSETLNDLQLELLADQEPGTTLDEVEAESQRAALTVEPPRERKPHPGRQRLPEHLERVETIVPCTEQTCRQCGAETAVIGYDESEQLDIVPARYFVRVIKREKRACRGCQKGAVTMAALEPRIIERGLASNPVVVETVTAKYLDHMPLYRQAAILEREAGLEIGRATLDGWVMRVGELLEPVAGAMRLDLLRSSYLQADETIVPVQMHDKRGADHQAYLWQYGRPGGETVFDFQLGRGREGPRKFLGAWEGILQTDGYQAYDGVGGPKLVHVGCWAHARRKFVDAAKVNGEDVSAVQMVMRMDGLFLVDRDARQKHMTAEERLAARRQHVEAWAEEIRQECEKLMPTMAEAAPGVRLRGNRTIQQSGGELDAARSIGSEELVARGQCQGWTESRGDSLDCGILPPLARPRAGVSARHPTRPGWPETVRGRPPHARQLVSRPQLTTPGFV